MFIFVWIIKLSVSYYMLFNPNATKDSSKLNKDTNEQDIQFWIKSVSDYMGLSTGIILSGVRFNEPFLVYLMKDFICSCFGILLAEEGDGIQAQALSTFLASSLNVELVHIILKGIKKFSNIRMDDFESEDSQSMHSYDGIK